MIDRRARDTLANALAGFMRGAIHSRRFDETVSDCAWGGRVSDPAVVAIAEQLYALYDDFRDGPIRDEVDIRSLPRVLAFLRSDLEYAGADLDREWDAVRGFWPFATLQQWHAHEHLCPAQPPSYDPSLRPPRKSWMQAAGEILALVIAALLLAAALAAWAIQAR